MSTVERIPVTDLQPGDYLNLEGDPIADGPCAYEDPDCQRHRQQMHEMEYSVVTAIEREADNCIRVDFENDDSYGFPPDHIVLREGHDVRYDEENEHAH